MKFFITLWPMWGILAALLLGEWSFGGPSYPHVFISNETLKVLIYLPDPQKGYYRASRFDWSGFAGKVYFAGGTYFSDFSVPHDPTFSGAGTGIADEFSEPLGFAGPGKPFIKIGVGVLRATNGGAYSFGFSYPIERPGEWKVIPGKDRIQFSQALSEAGYGYRYDKKIFLKGEELIVDFSLSNLGAKPIATSWYAHNFFVPENEGVGTNDSLVLNFNLPFANRWRDRIDIRGNEVQPKRNFQSEIVALSLDGLVCPTETSRAVIHNGKLGTGVEIRPEFPVARYALYLAQGGFCPEPFFSIQLIPGAATNWRTRYRFFRGPKPIVDAGEIEHHSVSGFKGVRLDQREIDTFNFNKTNYSVAILDGKIPRVSAYGLDSGESFEVKQSASFSQPAQIVLRGGKYSGRSYGIRFVRIDGISVSASETNDNLPIYSLDEDPDTSWVGEQDGGFIRYDFSLPKNLAGIGVVFRSGDKRRAFYEVASSSDGTSWEKDFSGSSSGTNASVEKVALIHPSAVKSIRIIGHGNSQNKYHNIVQVYFYEER